MDSTIPFEGIPTEVHVADDYDLDNYQNSPANEEMIERYDHEQVEINEDKEIENPDMVVDSNVAVAMDPEEAEDVVVLSPLVNVANIFRIESTRCEVIFMPPNESKSFSTKLIWIYHLNPGRIATPITKCSVIYGYGVVVERSIANMAPVRYFYCMAHSTCRRAANKFKMSNGGTSGAADHLSTRHGIRAQKSVMVEEKRTALIGNHRRTIHSTHSRILFHPHCLSLSQ